MIDWTPIRGFDWDDGNARKNADKHEVGQSEAEQIFFNDPLLVLADRKHSEGEVPYHALGHTDDERRLHTTFTLHDGGTGTGCASTASHRGGGAPTGTAGVCM